LRVRVVAGLFALVGILTIAVLPPARLPDAGQPVATDVPVIYHVHTTRSDGTGSREDVARAAAQAGAAVVILTDHGDGQRAVEPPMYLDGALVVDAVEVSSSAGHYVALAAAPAPYPLGGEPRAVVEDVRRLGGFGIVAHPGSRRDSLRWRDWDAGVDGLEWLNADSAWRERPSALWRTVVAYPWRPVEALTAILARPAFELQQWDRLAARGAVVGLAAHDAHARLGPGGLGEPYDGRVALAAPGYQPLFASFSNIVRLPSALSGNAAVDAASVLGAIRAGRVYSAVTGIARPGQVRFDAASDGRVGGMGEHLIPRGHVTISFEADVPTGALSRLVCGGEVVTSAAGGRLSWTSAGVPGACRVEVHVPWAGAERLWLVTNPIYVRPELVPAVPGEVPSTTETRAVIAAPDRWTIERAADAAAAIAASTASVGGVEFTFRLGADAESFAALQLAAPPDLAAFDSLVLTASADRPMRLWLQLRASDGDDQRWGRSIHLDGETRTVRVPFASMLPLGAVEQSRPTLATVTAVLIVIDTVHAAPGSAGRVAIEAVALAR
jgi:hypothetical protein